ncbi:MAG: PorV/PorQ family protein [Elusimicrobia bacterium]|nr:PorV/PorQ family protein [Elusimicrobiota bacterium]
MRIETLAAMLLLAPAAVSAGGAGDAMPFLKMDAGARAAALSGAYSAAGDDALCVFYNPAGTALAAKKEALLGHNEWVQDMRNETLAYVHPLDPRFTVFAGANLLLGGKMDRYDAAGAADGSFSPLEGAVSAGGSAWLGRGWYLGAALKNLSQQAAGEKASAWAADAGVLKKAGDWRVGLAAANFGSSIKLGRDKFDLPLTLRGGVSYTFLGDYTAAAEWIRAGGSDDAVAAGAEARLKTGPKEYFFVRAGYRSGRSRYAGPGLTAGAGLANRDLRIDYAFVPYGDLGDSHRVTVAFRFGADRPAPFDRAAYYGLPKPRKPAPAAEKKAGKKAGGQEGKKENVYFMW